METAQEIKPLSGSITRQLTRRVLLLGLIAGIAVVSVLALSLIITLQQVQAQMDDKNIEAARAFELFFLDIQSDLLASSTVVSSNDNPEGDLLQILARNRAIADVLLVGFDGEILAQKSEVSRPKLSEFKRKEWLTNPPSYNEALIGPVTFEGSRPMVDMVVLVTDEIGLSTGILLARVDLTELWNATLDVRVGQMGYAYITDETGQVVAFRNRRVIESGNTLEELIDRAPQDIAGSWLAFYRGLNDQPVLAKARALEIVPWFAVVEQPLVEALEPVYIPALVLALVLIGVGVTLFGTTKFTRNRIVSPLGALTAAVGQMSEGNLNQKVEVKYNDEFGQLGHSFNSMSGQLQDLFSTLEQRVAGRTRRLEIIATIAERLGVILNLEALLAEIVDQVKENFQYYHAHIYLLDNRREKLVVAAGTGQAGKEMVAQGHNIALDAPTSLVARAARTGQVVRVDNVREASDWLPNKLLPDTYSEMAVPIVLEDVVVGVLDVQQDRIAGLDEGDAGLLRSLAGQAAVAIRNVRQFEEVEMALTEARKLQRLYVEQAWDRSKAARRGVGRVQFSLGAPAALAEATVAEARQQAMAAAEPTVIALADPDPGDTNLNPKQALVAPITLHGTTIGNLQLHELQPDRKWTNSELTLIKAVVDQIAQVAENLRLINETQERASRERLIGQVSDKLRRAPDMDTLLRTAVAELARTLGPDRAFIRFGSAAEFGVTPENEGADNDEVVPTTAADSQANKPAEVTTQEPSPPTGGNGKEPKLNVNGNAQA